MHDMAVMMIFTEFSRVNCFFFEWGGMAGETFVQTGTFDLQARFETILSHWLNQHKLVVLCRHLRPIAD